MFSQRVLTSAGRLRRSRNSYGSNNNSRYSSLLANALGSQYDQLLTSTSNNDSSNDKYDKIRYKPTRIGCTQHHYYSLPRYTQQRYFSKKSQTPGKSHFLQRQRPPPTEPESKGFIDKFVKPTLEGKGKVPLIPRTAARHPKARLEPVKGRSVPLDWQDSADADDAVEVDVVNAVDDDGDDDEDDMVEDKRSMIKVFQEYVAKQRKKSGRRSSNDGGSSSDDDDDGSSSSSSSDDSDAENDKPVTRKRRKNKEAQDASRTSDMFRGKFKIIEKNAALRDAAIKANLVTPVKTVTTQTPWEKKYSKDTPLPYDENRAELDYINNFIDEQGFVDELDFENKYHEELYNEVRKEIEAGGGDPNDYEDEDDGDDEYEEDDEGNEEKQRFDDALAGMIHHKQTQGIDELYRDDYFAPQFYLEEKYYWHEEDYDDWMKDVSYFLNDDNDEENGPTEGDDGGAEKSAKNDNDDDEDDEDRDIVKLFNDNVDAHAEEMDLFAIAERDSNEFPDEVDNSLQRRYPVLPLYDHGTNVTDFLDAMESHPGEYARVTYHNLHYDSKREPVPLYPPYRRNPPLEFVEKYKRFLYVSGLPVLKIQDKVGDLDDPLHYRELQTIVSRLVDVDSSQVFCASTSSAFVGFDSPRDLYNAIKAGPTEEQIATSCSVDKYTESSIEGFDGSNGTVVKFTGFKTGHSSDSLLKSIFQSNPDVSKIYSDIKSDDIRFLTSTSALIRFKSQEEAESALESDILYEQLEKAASYPVKYLRARRELVHVTRDEDEETRKLGPRMIVDGDMPIKELYQSHGRVIQLRGVPSDMTRDELNDYFQQFCSRLRDPVGSIEIVTCELGNPTGIVYVGFEDHAEAKKFLRKFAGKVTINNRVLKVKATKDRIPPGSTYQTPSAYSARDTDELLDDLQNWEKFVDPEDIAFLDKNGMKKEALDDALRTLRYRNEYFGTFDRTIRSDAIEPDKEEGQLYKDIVQLYIEELKDCVTTEEDPGVAYLSNFEEGEEIDLSYFHDEMKHMERLKESRQNPKI